MVLKLVQVYGATVRGRVKTRTQASQLPAQCAQQWEQSGLALVLSSGRDPGFTTHSLCTSLSFSEPQTPCRRIRMDEPRERTPWGGTGVGALHACLES